MRKLSDYYLYGGFHKIRAASDDYDWCMDDLEFFQEFLKFRQRLGLVKNTVKTDLARIHKFYDFMIAKGIRSIKNLTPEVMSNYYLSMAGDSPRYAQDKLAALRAYLHFAYTHQYTDQNFSKVVPKMRAVKNKNIPAMWADDEVEKLLDSIDKSSPAGKRDYAVVLLAATLGLRASDIGDLKLSNIDWDKKELRILQRKTKKINVCPLTDVLGWALIDYIKYARPKSDSPYLFLTFIAPYKPFGNTTAVSILNRAMQKADINCTVAGISRGMHSLRHSFARKLLDKDVDLELISNIMGHTKTTSSSPYLKIDIEGLRKCALELGEVYQYAQ
jgi:site-specific recombinase XerD